MEENKEQMAQYESASKARFQTTKLVIGIISMVLFIFITFQSCVAGVGNALSNNDEQSGTFGMFVAFNLLVSGIIAVAARKKNGKAPWIIATILLWLNYFYAKMFGGSFGDLRVWGFLSFAIGVFYLFSAMRTKKEYIASGIVSALYLIVALI